MRRGATLLVLVAGCGEATPSDTAELFVPTAGDYLFNEYWMDRTSSCGDGTVVEDRAYICAVSVGEFVPEEGTPLAFECGSELGGGGTLGNFECTLSGTAFDCEDGERWFGDNDAAYAVYDRVGTWTSESAFEGIHTGRLSCVGDADECESVWPDYPLPCGVDTDFDGTLE